MVYGTGELTYELVDGWAKLPQKWSFKDVCGVAVDADDRVYILSRSDHPVMVFDSEGNLLSSWGEGLFKRAHGICISPEGSIYCTDDGLHVVYKFTKEGVLLKTLGNKGQPSATGYEKECVDFLWSLTTITQGGAPFNSPTGVSVSATGEIYVSDGYGNARVHKFSPEGKLLLSWGEPGFGPGQFRLPHAIWVDKQERVWVPDRENNRIQIFNNQGELLTQWTELVRPSSLCIDDDGLVYVTEFCARVSVFTNEGKLLTRWGNEAGSDMEKALFLAPHAIAVDSGANVYVGEVCLTYCEVDRGARTVQKFARRT
jgi:DNA-binding beta-propeller fold protein YncE